jgi:hypothetical protein
LGPMAYYGFLATRVTPQRLIATAARRALRGAWSRIAPAPEAPADDRVLEVFRAPDAPRLAERLLARPWPARPSWTPEALRRSLARHLPEELDRVVARAERCAAGRLTVFGRDVDVRRSGGGTDWQLDPLHGGRFAGGATSTALPDAPGLDRKLAWAIGRGEQWVALAQGAVLDPRRGGDHADALAASVRDFVRDNPVGQGVHWTCAMEAALRAVNLGLALHLVAATRAPLDPGLALDAVRLLVASGRFVLANLEDETAVPNNHLAADWLGLLACAAFLPEWPEAPRWRALGAAGIRRALCDQVHADGTTFEGSAPYHRLALELFATALVVAHAGGTPLGAAYAGRLAAAFRAMRALLSFSGALPQLGDNDSGRVLAFRERGGLEGGYLLPLGAALLSRPELLVEPGPGDATEVAWLLGPEALERLARAKAGPAPGSSAFPQGGFHVVRRGGIEVFVSCGANGQRGVGGHSHNDKLALELRVGGRLVICDPGSPSYTGDADLRNAFRATRAHATVVVDGLEQAPIPPDRLFALPEAAGARLIALETGAGADRLVGEHRGFARAGVTHRREVIVVDGGAAVIDRLGGAGRHLVELRWPFPTRAARARAATRDEGDRLDALAGAARLTRPADHAQVVEVALADGGRVLLAFAVPAPLAPELTPSLYSPGYGEVVEAATALLAGELALPATLATLFLPLPLFRKGTLP